MRGQQQRNLEVILPTDQQKKVEGLRGAFRFLSPIFSNQQAEQEKLESQLFLLQEAIQREQVSYLLSLS